MVDSEFISGRIADLKQKREQITLEANLRIAALGGAIAELELLLRQNAEHSGVADDKPA